jgi:SET domain-containing protein
MKTDNVKVDLSRIHGTGVFATRDFKIGETVMFWDTSTKSWKNRQEFEAEKADLGEDARFAAHLDGLWVMLQSPERHVNYACSPSTVAQTTDQGPAYVALCDIAKGEEITADYSKEIPFEGKCAGCKGCR